MAILLLTAVSVIGFGAGSVAAQSAPDCSTVTYDGTGTDTDPYEVGNVNQLQCINDQGLGANYVQVSDIDASGTSSWNGGDGFAPIGDSSTEFTGTFDGVDNTVSGLTIDRGSTNDVGLFGFAGSGRLKNVTLVNVNITGGNDVGALVGKNNGTVRESYATGNVSGGFRVGGLVGDNSIGGTVEMSYATGSVSGGDSVGGLVGENFGGTVEMSYATGSASGNEAVGGLVGENFGGTVEMSYATGSVSGAADFVGGLVGFNNFGGTVTDSYATGSVSGFNNVGGFVGGNVLGSEITDAYARGDVVGNQDVGGVVGRNGDAFFDADSNVTRTYATGVVNGNTNMGGVVGSNSDGFVNDSYWDNISTTQNSAVGASSPDGSESDLMGFSSDSDGDNRADKMIGAAAETNMTAFDFTATWATVTNPDDYPVLIWQIPTASFTFSPTNPTTSDTVTFDASSSSDDTSIQTYEWDFDDGTTASGETATHSYSSPGTYTVELTVTDGDGLTDTEALVTDTEALDITFEEKDRRDLSRGEEQDTDRRRDRSRGESRRSDRRRNRGRGR